MTCIVWTCAMTCIAWTCAMTCIVWTCAMTCVAWTCAMTCIAWTCAIHTPHLLQRTPGLPVSTALPGGRCHHLWGPFGIVWLPLMLLVLPLLLLLLLHRNWGLELLSPGCAHVCCCSCMCGWPRNGRGVVESVCERESFTHKKCAGQAGTCSLL